MSTRADERRPLLEEDSGAASSSSETVNEAVAPAHDELEGARLHLALVFPLVALLFVAIDVTMVSTVSATMAAEFNSLAVVSWIGSAYLVAIAAVQPMSGKVTDRIGRRTGFFWALLFFGAGNLICALATSVPVLVIGRVAAGLGGGAISSIGVFITSDLLSLRRRTVWSGLQNVFFAAGMGIGGVFGGYINDAIGWRWAFVILVPCTVAVAIGAYFFLVKGLPRKQPGSAGEELSKPFDFVGSMLLISAIVSVILGLNLLEGNQNHLTSYILLIAAAVLLVVFVVAELRFISDPVIPLYLLGNRSVLGVCVAGFLTSLSMHNLVFYVPILIQTRGYNSSETGLQILGNPVGSSIGPPLAGLAMKIMGSYAVVKPLVYIMYLVGPIGFYFSSLATPAWVTFILMAFLGSGFGSILTFNLTGLLANIDHSLQAPGTSMQYAFRQIGASAGVALSGIIFRIRVEKELARFTKNVPGVLFGLDIPDDISKQCNRRNYVGDQPPVQCQAYFHAVHDVFLFTLITALAAFAFSMLIKNRSLDRSDDKKADD